MLRARVRLSEFLEYILVFKIILFQLCVFLSLWATVSLDVGLFLLSLFPAPMAYFNTHINLLSFSSFLESWARGSRFLCERSTFGVVSWIMAIFWKAILMDFGNYCLGFVMAPRTSLERLLLSVTALPFTHSDSKGAISLPSNYLSDVISN